ncbi:SDR family NAD(P)-dependent oxidoreductase [Nocardiopsis sp. HNM0947]|uniref:SDR family NAD(P)-dependent oxidoreductase n=1 Tax=Nocardiopsis coralli TaxID=2772213 RepID=A0ABR9P4X2_9ACTN|nr:SDR family NAD(P)-dependent oxidoreductase [Nocardiopsis coralli]
MGITVTWDHRNPPAAQGRTVAITGGSSGVGLWTALRLAEAGADTVLMCRGLDKGEQAADAIRSAVPGASVRTVHVDTSSGDSVRAAAAELRALPRLDALVNNAGLLISPKERQVSVDGYELTLATNALGHVLLTREVLPQLEKSGDSARVVWVGSMAAKLTRTTPDDLNLERGYNPWLAYAQSKLVMQAAAFELHRRLTAAGSPVRSLVAHPGYSLAVRSEPLGEAAPEREPTPAELLQYPLAQGQDGGALPVVRAAVDPEALGGQFYGPRGGLKGEPVVAGGVEGVPGAGHGGLGGPGKLSVNPVVGRACWAFASRAWGLEPDL